jgi:hypothetical protein
MRALLWFGSVLLMLAGFLLLIAGLFIAFSTDWQPTRSLRVDEVARIRAASAFVELRKRETGRLPIADEFQHWAQRAPEALRIDGVGFTYAADRPPVYEFSWWSGNAWLRWRSDSSATELAEISSADYFVFGSKLLDLLVFIGFGAGALVTASRISARGNGQNAS